VRSALAWVVAAASGAALWLGANLIEGSQEPWDAENYWTTYLHIAMLLCFILGAVFPENPWRWPFAVMLVQLPVMMVFTGKVGALIALGVVLLLFLSCAGMLFAWLGSALRHWADSGARG